MKKELERLYIKYKQKYSSEDPVWSLHNFKDERDIEILGLIAASYSYGQIGLINKFIGKILERVEERPYEFIRNFNLKRDGKIFKGMNYRFNNEFDLINLILNIKTNLEKYGSLLKLFLVNYSDEDENILNGLKYFSDSLRIKYVKDLKGFDYLMPNVSRNSTCKRLNLYLRWMVRKDEIDTGIWGKKVDKSKLIMPVDVHVYRVSRQMKLVERKSCDIKFAIELTERLKKYDASDPVKYDFALCHEDV